MITRTQIALVSLLLSTSAQAALVGKIKANALTWNNANQNGELVTPHLWSNYSAETVVAWQPSIPTVESRVVLTRRGGSGSGSNATVTISSVEVSTVQYNMNTGATETGPFFPGTATKNGNTFTKSGSGISSTFYGKSIEYINPQSPFTAFKPTIKLGNIVPLFDGEPNGIYEGNIVIKLPVVYKRTSSEQVTYKNHVVNLPIQITSNNITCDLTQGGGRTTVNLGTFGADAISSPGAHTTDVPILLTCSGSLVNGTITFSGAKASGTSATNVVEARVRGGTNSGAVIPGLGVELDFANTSIAPMRLNSPSNFTQAYNSGTRVYNLSLKARPVFTFPAAQVGLGPYQSTVNFVYAAH